MIGRNFIVKKNFLNTLQKVCLKIPFCYQEIIKKSKMISLKWNVLWPCLLQTKMCLIS